MADLKKITLPSGTTYNLVDQGARDLIAALEGSTAWLGVTTTPLTDGATTNPITVGGESVTAKTGSMVAYNKKEFVFDGTKWQEFGDLSALGDLAYKDSAAGSYTPAGTVSTPTVTLTPTTDTVTPINSVGTLPTVSMPVFSATVANETLTLGWTEGTYTAGTLPTKGSDVTVVTGVSATASQPTFTGTGATITVK